MQKIAGLQLSDSNCAYKRKDNTKREFADNGQTKVFTSERRLVEFFCTSLVCIIFFLSGQ